MKKSASKSYVVKAQVITREGIQKKSNALTQDETVSPTGAQQPPIAFSTISALQGFNAWHGRCINLKAQMTAGLGFTCSPEAEKFFKAHAQYAGQSINETLVNLQKDYEEFGNAFLEVVRNNAGDIAEIYHLPARYCFIYVDKDSKEQYLTQEVGLTKKTFRRFGSQNKSLGVSEYIHIKSYSSQSVFYGIPEWMGATGAIVLDRNGVEFNAAKFGNNGVPDFIISVMGGALAEGSIPMIQDFWQKSFKGTANAGKTLLLTSENKDSKIEVEALGEAIKDGSYSQLRHDARDEVVAAHGVPPALIGVLSAGSLSGGTESKEQIKMFKKLSIDPRQGKIEFVFNDMIFPDMGIDGQMKLNSIDLSDNTNDATMIAQLMPLGVITATEGREWLGLKGDAPAVAPLGKEIAKQLLDFRMLLEHMREARYE